MMKPLPLAPTTLYTISFKCICSPFHNYSLIFTL